MNIQPGRQSAKRSRNSSTGRRSAGEGNFLNWLTVICQAALLLGAAAAIFHAYISLNQQISVTDREITRTKREIAAVEREYDAMRNLYARRSNLAYIRSQIARFHLPLQAASSTQKRVLTLRSPQEAARTPFPSPGQRIADTRNAQKNTPLPRRRRSN